VLAGDSLGMSAAHGQEKGVIGIHWTWYPKYRELLEVLPLIEAKLEPLGAKPMFGKLFVMSGDKFERLYGNDLKVFRSLVARHDPKGKFTNPYMKSLLFNSKSFHHSYAKL